MLQWKSVFVAFLALALAGCAGRANAPTFEEVAATLPPPGGNARLFVYRNLERSQSPSWVPVRANGVRLGAVGNGYVMVCDLTPGPYTIEAQSPTLYPNQARTVSLAAGQEAFARIGSFRSANPQSRSNTLTSTFVVMLQDPATGQREVGPLWYTPCNRPPG